MLSIFYCLVLNACWICYGVAVMSSPRIIYGCTEIFVVGAVDDGGGEGD